MDRYFRNTTTNILTEFVTADNVTPPDGHDAILKTAIRAIYSGDILLGGVWDGLAYTRPSGQPTVAQAQRANLHIAYDWWNNHGRRSSWAGLRAGDLKFTPLDATDRWVYHQVALGDRISRAEIWTNFTAADRQAAVDHIVNALRTLGPTWYGVMVGDGTKAVAWAAANIADNANLYTDIFTILGVAKGPNGEFDGLPSTTLGNRKIKVGFDPEVSNLGNA